MYLYTRLCLQILPAGSAAADARFRHGTEIQTAYYSLALCPAPVQFAGRHFDGSHLAGSHFDKSHLVGSHLVGSQEAVLATGPAGVPGWAADANTAVPVCSAPVICVAAAPFTPDFPAEQTALQEGLGWHAAV